MRDPSGSSINFVSKTENGEESDYVILSCLEAAVTRRYPRSTRSTRGTRSTRISADFNFFIKFDEFVDFLANLFNGKKS